jgi:hypothetical protein
MLLYISVGLVVHSLGYRPVRQCRAQAINQAGQPFAHLLLIVTSSGFAEAMPVTRTIISCCGSLVLVHFCSVLCSSSEAVVVTTLSCG